MSWADWTASPMAEVPCPLVPTVSTTGQPSISESELALTLRPAFSATSIMLRTTTMGMRRSVTCVRRYSPLSRLEASMMHIATSGLLSESPIRKSRETTSSGLYGDNE